MPAYFSIEVTFKSNILYPNFVKDIYSLLAQSGYKFKSGYWFGENMSFDNIIEWNQKLLQKKFELGYRQHVKHDYKQILLDTNDYEEMRAFWMYLNDHINFSIIIPECDVLANEEGLIFLQDKIYPLINMSCDLWNTGFVSLIQSCLELDSWIDEKELKDGKLPTIDPFCIIDIDSFYRNDSLVNGKYKIDILSNNGVLIIGDSLLEDKSSSTSDTFK